MLRRLSPILLAGCVTSTSVTYLPSPEQPRLALDEGRATLERFVGLECDRLTAAGLAARQADFLVLTDSAGLATSAELRQSTGDARIDGLAGAVAAQLDLGSSAGGALRTTLRAGYSCTAGGASATIERRP